MNENEIYKFKDLIVKGAKEEFRETLLKEWGMMEAILKRENSWFTVSLETKLSSAGRAASYKNPKLEIHEVKGDPIPEDQLRKAVERMLFWMQKINKETEEKINV